MRVVEIVCLNGSDVISQTFLHLYSDDLENATWRRQRITAPEIISWCEARMNLVQVKLHSGHWIVRLPAATQSRQVYDWLCVGYALDRPTNFEGHCLVSYRCLVFPQSDVIRLSIANWRKPWPVPSRDIHNCWPRGSLEVNHALVKALLCILHNQDG